MSSKMNPQPVLIHPRIEKEERRNLETAMTTTVLETYGVPPPPGAAAELSLPLSFFDMLWVHKLHNDPIRNLIFYDHPCSKAEFLDSIVPCLKQSLTLTLKHYLPVAANLLYPLDTRIKPVFRYVSGDTVPLTVAVSDRDLDELTGYHALDSDQFYEFIPQMPPLIEEGEYNIVPLVALQATLFPGRGICIGLSYHHCLGDARSMFEFMWAWASITKFGGDEQFLSEKGESLPILDRSSVYEDFGRIEDVFWNVFNKVPLKPSSFPLPTNRFRASFTLYQSDIKKLKNLVLSKNPTLVHVSSFVVTAAYTWSCLVKSADAIGEEVGEDEVETFFLSADGRGRPNALVDPPVPVNYFGNLLGGGFVNIEHGKVAAGDGYVVAAEAIADQIKNQVNNKEKFLKDPESWLSIENFQKMRLLGVSGSPKFDSSNADFGWGKARRLEVLSTDGETYSVSLCNSGDADGGLLVGLSLPKERMEAFAAIFADGINS